MNEKAQNFKDYLDEKNITCFRVEDVENDKFNAVVFHSSININGQLLPMGIILDDSIYGVIRVQVAPSVQNKDKLLAYFDELNAKYKSFKYYTNETGIYLDTCVLGVKQDSELIIAVTDTIVKNLEEEYAKIMNLLWSK